MIETFAGGPGRPESNEELKPGPIRVFSTGGTIDSSPEYDPNQKSVFEGTHLPQMLAQAQLSTVATLQPLMQKDSMDITDKDRELIYDSCVNANEKRILITHGTDTIVETARFLGEKGVGEKTLVLVGSFIPLSQPNSDGFFNLGYALAATHLLPSGVYVAINGQVFPWNDLRKNREEKKFERIK